MLVFFFSSRRRHTRCSRDWSSDVCSSDHRLRTIHGDATLAVFDWEEAGWGVPAVDLAQQLTVQSGQLSANPDVSSYWSAGREGWPDLSSEACWRLAYCGTVFRTLSAMSWIADDLANDWAHASLRDTRLYAAELGAALQERSISRSCGSSTISTS